MKDPISEAYRPVEYIAKAATRNHDRSVLLIYGIGLSTIGLLFSCLTIGLLLGNVLKISSLPTAIAFQLLICCPCSVLGCVISAIVWIKKQNWKSNISILVGLVSVPTSLYVFWVLGRCSVAAVAI